MQNQTHLLKSQKFLPLFVTQFFGAFNDNVFKNAFLIWFTYDVAQKLQIDAQIMVTIASGLFILPFFLFSALAGQVADKYEKSTIIRLIKLCEIIIMAFSFIGFYFENLYLLLFLLFLMGVHSTFFGPLKYSLLPEHLKDDELISGNALIEGGTFLAILFGTILGGIVVRTSYGILIISAAVMLFAIIGWLSSLHVPRSPASDPLLKINFNIIKPTWDIIKYAQREKSVWLSIIATSWFWFVGVTFLSQFPSYTKDVIHGNEYIVTLFLSIFSIGIGVGSVMCNKLLKGSINARLVPAGSIGMTVGIAIFCAASYFYSATTQVDQLIGLYDFLTLNIYSLFIVLGLLIIAVCAGIYIVPLYAIIQHRADAQYVSRVIAANNVLNALFMVVSSISLVILFALNFTIIEVFALVGLGNIIVFLFIKKIVKQRLANA